MPVAWNTNFDAAGGGLFWAALRSGELAQTFADALNERVAAAFWVRAAAWPASSAERGRVTMGFYEEGPGADASPFVTLPAGAQPPLAATGGPTAGGISVAFPDTGAGFWNRLQQKVLHLARWFVDSQAAGWEERNELGPPAVAMAMAPSDFRRRRPREIYTLSAPGADGQVARFVAYLGTRWYGQGPASDAAGLATTPPAERVHAGKLFVRDGPAWRRVDDPGLVPDVVEATGLALPGDTFGPWVAQDLRDAMNRLGEVFRTELPLFVPESAAGGPARAVFERIAPVKPPDTYLKASNDPTIAGAEAQFGEVTAHNVQDYYFFTFPVPPGVIFNASNDLGLGLVQMSRTRFVVWSDRLPDPPPGGRRALCTGYVRATAPRYLNTGQVATFDNYGDPVQEDRWTALPGPGLATGEYTSQPVGTLEQPPTGEPGEKRGYGGRIGLLLNFAVVGGFRYSPVSNG